MWGGARGGGGGRGVKDWRAGWCVERGCGCGCVGIGGRLSMDQRYSQEGDPTGAKSQPAGVGPRVGRG